MHYELNKFMLCLRTLNVFSSLAFAITFTFVLMVTSYNVIILMLTSPGSHVVSM